MIKVYNIPGRRMTKAIITSDGNDAIRTAVKRSGGDFSKLYELTINTMYSGTVVCDERDEYDEATGNDLATKKAMHNYRKGVAKAFKRWQVKVMLALYNANPGTFDSAVEIVKAKVNKREPYADTV